MFECITGNLREALKAIAAAKTGEPLVVSELTESVSQEDVVREYEASTEAFSSWIEQISPTRLIGEFSVMCQQVETMSGGCLNQETREQRLAQGDPGTGIFPTVQL